MNCMIAGLLVFFIGAGMPQATGTTPSFAISFEKFTLGNGLQVVLHHDASDPIVAMATLVHVGSNRERPGKTGFAHFFEHMAFNDSENVPRGANRKMIEEWGGSRNGGTSADYTIYHEVVPTDALDKLMWIDSDRLGFMINTVTYEALQNEIQVVKNEKRQRVDNVPYGHEGTIVAANLYPDGHPYSWPVIGSLQDLQNATLEDVKEFYSRFYGPNNATLVVSGSFDPKTIRSTIEKWFGEIKPGPDVPDLKPHPVVLTESKSLYHLDAFASVPQLSITFPSVEDFHPDSYALDVLAELMATGRRAPLFQVLIENKKLASNVRTSQISQELAGTFSIRVIANEGVHLDQVKAGVDEALKHFKENPFGASDLERIKTRQETQFYEENDSILGKAFSLARFNTFKKDPGYLSQHINAIRAVSREDVMRVFEKYVDQKHAVMVSMVPKSTPHLILSNSNLAEIYEEPIVKGAEKTYVVEEANVAKTPTRVDRSMPKDGPLPLMKQPTVWAKNTPSGIPIYGITSNELPLAKFSLTLKGGHLLDPMAKPGLAHVTALLLNEGTARRTPAELEEAIGLLGSHLRFGVEKEEIRLIGSSLTRNFNATMALAAEMLFEPRWDPADFERIRKTAMNTARMREANPSSFAARHLESVLYGNAHIFSKPMEGSIESLERITLEDVKAFYLRNFSPKVCTFQVTGAVNAEQVLAAVSVFQKKWPADQVAFPIYPAPPIPEKPQLYFLDIPGAKQSVLMAATPCVSGADPDWFTLNVAHNRLGDGSSARLTQVLRIDKGYTYGAATNLLRHNQVSPLIATTSVRANVTFESLDLLRQIIRDYGPAFSQKDLDLTKNILTKRNASRLETLNQKLRLLEIIAKFGLPLDIEDRNQKRLAQLDLESLRATMNRYINDNRMVYLVAGDGKTQMAELSKFGLGQPIVLGR